jgi:hypothetical protein
MKLEHKGSLKLFAELQYLVCGPGYGYFTSQSLSLSNEELDLPIMAAAG